MGYFALRFLFVNVYHKEWAKEYLPTPKVAKTLPLVLSKEEVFDILKTHGKKYIQEHNIKGQQKGIINLLSSCRTVALGTHFRRCDHCSIIDKANNSCRNRHCPNCQNKDREQGLDKRMKELLISVKFRISINLY